MFYSQIYFPSILYPRCTYFKSHVNSNRSYTRTIPSLLQLYHMSVFFFRISLFHSVTVKYLQLCWCLFETLVPPKTSDVSLECWNPRTNNTLASRSQNITCKIISDTFGIPSDFATPPGNTSFHHRLQKTKK